MPRRGHGPFQLEITMLFKHLAALIAKGVEVQIAVSAADNGKLEVAFFPTSSTGKSGLNLVAKSFVGTPDELDADFASVVAGYVSVNTSLAEQLATLQAQADAIAADAAAKAKAPGKTVSSVAKSVAPKPRIATSAASDVDDGEGSNEDDKIVATTPITTSASTSGEAAADAVQPMTFTL